MNIPSGLKYTKEHEWIKIEGDKGIVGITDYAQNQLGDIVFIEIETIGEKVNQADPFGTIEAVKTVSDLFMPVTGVVLEKNPKLEESPELVNTDPYNEGWLIKIAIENPNEVDNLMNADAYEKLVEE